jgi:AcrR family transcriptional regulator
MSSLSLASRPTASRGRPRSEKARRAVLDAACHLFEAGGYPATTIEAIAARSGVAKTTIYRWWPNRAALVVELLLKIAAVQAPPPIAGKDPLGELRKEMLMVGRASNALPGQLLLSLMGEGQNDLEVREALAKGLFRPRRHATAEVIRQAQEKGDLCKGIAPLVATDLLFGPIFYRRFVRHEAVTDAFVKEIFEYAMTGLASSRMKQTLLPRTAKPKRAR